jgi:hypothetical protein
MHSKYRECRLVNDSRSAFSSIEAVAARLGEAGYIADRRAALAIYLAQNLNANQLGRGPRPASVEPESVKELMAAGVLLREGHARGTTYLLLKRPSDLQADARIRFDAKRTAPRAAPAIAHHRSDAILTLGPSEKAYIRANVREYLAFATSVEARKHEQRRQSDDILDLIHVRAKEILRISRLEGGPRMTPLDAARQAQVEIALDFEQLLKVKWMPIMFELFGMEETADTDMRTLRR